MGYYTRYTLTTYSTNEKTYNGDIENLIENDLATISGYEITIDKITDDIKWYKHDENMCTLSKKYPNICFCLEGEGEENGDTWKLYYVNGISSEVIRPIWPDYDYKDFYEKNRKEHDYKNEQLEALNSKLKEIDLSIIEHEKKIEHNINDLILKKDIENSKKFEIEEQIKKLLTS
jgi:hypothetical protein